MMHVNVHVKGCRPRIETQFRCVAGSFHFFQLCQMQLVGSVRQEVSDAKTWSVWLTFPIIYNVLYIVLCGLYVTVKRHHDTSVSKLFSSAVQ